MAMVGIQVRKATIADVPLLLPGLVEAFAPQPLTQWVLGQDGGALRRGERVLELDFRNGLAYDLTYTTAELQGAAIWHPPGAKETLWQTLTWLVRLAQAVRISPQIGVQLRAFYGFKKRMPKTSYYYLAMLGVAPAWQGRGIGSALLQPVLGRCDAEHLPAFLATDTESNVHFYERHGFQVQEIVPIPQARLRWWAMWREPRS